MINRDDRNWYRLCNTIDGFRLRFGRWPQRVIMHRAGVEDLREYILTPADFATLTTKLQLVTVDVLNVIAQDDTSAEYNLDKEGAPDEKPQPSAADWLGVQPSPPTGWEIRYCKAINTTAELIQEAGWPLTGTVFGCFKGAKGKRFKTEDMLNAEINLDPDRHEPESIAHEIAHGVYEALRHDPRYKTRLLVKTRKEFCQMVRSEVERRLGRTWVPKSAAGFYKRFHDWDEFVSWVNAGC